MDQVTAALFAHPESKAVVLTSPDYYGVAPDVRAIAAAVHEHGVPLVMDEAWGPHFPFHPDFPPSAMAGGADMAVGSIHKTMGASSRRRSST